MNEEERRFFEAIENYVEAKMVLEKARDAYTGYSPGWALQREYDALDDATKALSQYFRAAVKAVK